MPRFIVIHWLLFVMHLGLHASTIPSHIDIGIFSGQNLRKFSFVPLTGRYIICDPNHKKVTELKPFSSIIVQRHNNGFSIFQDDSLIYSGSDITLQGGAFQNSFLLVPMDRNTEPRMYDGDLTLSFSNRQIDLINTAPFESYVAGTVQWESGHNRHEEFYKVQAVIIRTYALSNLQRHRRQGFHLCDQVHCQAYYGKSINPNILEAVKATRGMVVTDHNNNLINTVYHANCGGQTVNSEDLWPHSYPYLRSRNDIYCRSMPGAQWEYSISIADLRRYLSHSHSYQPNASQWRHIENLRQNTRIHHIDPERNIHLSEIRDHFGLRSTYFSVTPRNDSLHLQGRGFGHGVGLCQEGAMQRAEKGYSKLEILKFYYLGARLTQWEHQPLFRQKK